MMAFNTGELTLLIPEMLMLSMACVVLVADLFIPEQRRGITYLLSMATLVFTAISILRLHDGTAIATTVIMHGAFVRDQLGDILKLCILGVTGIVFVYSKAYLRERGLFKGEFYVLCLFAVLGMMVIVSSANMLSVYLGIELLALSSYALVALNRDSGVASEAAMKYFVLGAMASGMLLYGISMIYGATGSIDFQTISEVIAAGEANGMILSFGLVFVVIGLAFKFGAVPFHMWLPDVYVGAPTAVTLFISSAPKLAAVAMALRLLDFGLGGLFEHWQQMLVIMSVLSLMIGNVVAIAQTNIKRMLAYSTIAHVGFILLGILSGTETGYAAAMFYAITYAIMSAGAFGVVILLSRSGFEADSLDDFAGLNKRNPWYAFVMLSMMASLAGVPPFVGFFAKLQIINSVVEVNLTWLAIVAVIFSVIGAFYYLRIIKLMYMDEPTDEHPITPRIDMATVLSVNGALQLLLSIFAGPLIAVCVVAVSGIPG